MKELEKLKENIEYLSEDQAKMLNDILTLRSYSSKRALLEVGGYDTSKTYDTAYPIGVADHIKQVYPRFYDGCYIYDYSQERHGELVNINDMIVKRLLKVMYYG